MKALLSFATGPNILPHFHIFLGSNCESSLQGPPHGPSPFVLRWSQKTAEPLVQRCPCQTPLSGQSWTGSPGVGQDAEREQNPLKNTMRNKTIILTTQENLLLHPSALKLGSHKYRILFGEQFDIKGKLTVDLLGLN